MIAMYQKIQRSPVRIMTGVLTKTTENRLED